MSEKTSPIEAAATAGPAAYTTAMIEAGVPHVWRHVAVTVITAALDAVDLERVQIAHDRRIWSSGEVECACGEWQVTRDAAGYRRSTNEFRAEAVRAHMVHVAEAIRAALLEGSDR